MNHISSYPSIYALGHRAIAGLFADPVLIEEKIDGSQFSFGRINGELTCRSKGKDLIIDAPEKMFARAVEVAMELPLHDGWIYRGEYLKSPKHNTLTYSRAPVKNIILFDVCTGPETYLSYEAKAAEALRIGLEVVPLLHSGLVDGFGTLGELLNTDSILGGCKIEGFVVKNYSIFTPDKKIAIGKYVSEAFKECHSIEWKKSNPTVKDVVGELVTEFTTPARWQKAIQHLREGGTIEGSPRDIGALMKEIPEDILRDSKQAIADRLFDHFWPQIRRRVTAGFPEYYKQQLAESAFAPK